MKPFEGTAVLITGASSGIGRATALHLAMAGADVALVARGAERLKQVAEEIHQYGRRALILPADVTRREEVESAVATTCATWGKVDVLVANAGQYIRAPVLELDVSDIHRAMEVNFYGALYAVLAVLPHMRRRGSGHIVLVSSLDGHFGLPMDAPYVASKFALRGFGEVLRQELRPHGLRVTTVCPGRVDTPLIGDIEVPAISAKIPPEQVARAIGGALQRYRPEIIVPASGQLLKIIYAFSIPLGDWLVRSLRLQGWKSSSRES